jgi:hypothetical protein
MTCPNSSVQLLFPGRLYTLLEECEKNDDESNIISWSPLGNSFKVHNKELFAKKILPRYFRQSNYKSFVRQCKGIFSGESYLVTRNNNNNKNKELTTWLMHLLACLAPAAAVSSHHSPSVVTVRKP